MKEAKSKSFFVVKDLVNNPQPTMYAQRMVVYPVAKSCRDPFDEIKRQAIYYDATYHLVDEICGVRKQIGSFQVLVNWSGIEDDMDKT